MALPAVRILCKEFQPVLHALTDKRVDVLACINTAFGGSDWQICRIGCSKLHNSRDATELVVKAWYSAESPTGLNRPVIAEHHPVVANDSPACLLRSEATKFVLGLLLLRF